MNITSLRKLLVVKATSYRDPASRTPSRGVLHGTQMKAVPLGAKDPSNFTTGR